MFFNGFLGLVGIGRASRIKRIFIFPNPLIIYWVTAIQVLETTVFLLKKNLVFIFISKNNDFRKKSLIEPQSYFERPIFLYYLFFYFRTSNFHVWRHSVDDTFPRATHSLIRTLNCRQGFTQYNFIAQPS